MVRQRTIKLMEETGFRGHFATWRFKPRMNYEVKPVDLNHHFKNLSRIE